jgi:hypothetical protein
VDDDHSESVCLKPDGSEADMEQVRCEVDELYDDNPSTPGPPRMLSVEDGQVCKMLFDEAGDASRVTRGRRRETRADRIRVTCWNSVDLNANRNDCECDRERKNTKESEGCW